MFVLLFFWGGSFSSWVLSILALACQVLGSENSRSGQACLLRSSESEKGVGQVSFKTMICHIDDHCLLVLTGESSFQSFLGGVK